MAKPLIVGVDIRDLRVAKTGTKTYLEELCREFKKLHSEQIRFYFLDTRLAGYNGSNKLLKYVEHFRYQLWKQLILPVKAWLKGCNVLFCTDNFVPLIHLGYQTIPVFHDAFFFENPEHYGKLWLWLYKKTALPAARKSAYVVTPSAYARKQIHQYTHLPLEKLVVVYEGPKTIASYADASDQHDILRRFKLQPKAYLLHVGSMFKRKNIPALIYAFKTIKESGYAHLKLVLAGAPPANISSDFNEIEKAILETNLGNDIIFTGYLADEELAGLYSNASLYVFPSVNEGFGIPVLEAFKFGVPVLVADNTSLPEVGGNAVISFNPFNINDIAEKVVLLLNNQPLKQDLVDKGYQRLKLFSWQKAAAELVQLFQSIV